MEMHLKTGKAPIFRYRFEQMLPLAEGAPPDAQPSAPHASEIEFVFGVLSGKNCRGAPKTARCRN